MKEPEDRAVENSLMYSYVHINTVLYNCFAFFSFVLPKARSLGRQVSTSTVTKPGVSGSRPTTIIALYTFSLRRPVLLSYFPTQTLSFWYRYPRRRIALYRQSLESRLPGGYPSRSRSRFVNKSKRERAKYALREDNAFHGVDKYGKTVPSRILKRLHLFMLSHL